MENEIKKHKDIFMECNSCKAYIYNGFIILTAPIVLIGSTPYIICFLSYSVAYECIYNKRPY